MPFPRMTTRRWMLAVAAVALVLGTLSALVTTGCRLYDAYSYEDAAYALDRTASDFERKAERAESAAERRRWGDIAAETRASAGRFSQRAARAWRAARYPWLPVPPDPPPPE